MLSDFLANTRSDELVFERVGFKDPFLLVYSSGTTGTPKVSASKDLVRIVALKSPLTS
jgi:acyl-coenzyme A synthetase/AMP-(fatty) acid ligase